MKKKIFFATAGMCFILNSVFYNVVSENHLLPDNVGYVYAQNQMVQYTYDALGRIISVKYPDGTKIIYTYDANGNILSCEKVKEQANPGGEDPSGGNQPGETPSGGEQPGENPSGGNQSDNSSKPNETNPGNSNSSTVEKPVVSNPSKTTAADIKNYNKFKKRKPVIKSLKKTKSKKKYYLNIKIKQVNKKGLYGESIYQIKYADNNKFKKAKTVKVTRNKKSSITGKKWKVKKGKTYYVKVRAGMKTKTGKTIYTKYSKVKKIKI
ncbi:MAG: RHS repeat protein [Lachnospiraceae bacterium]|nr:RHS repeat protein [Lachnospiraceae bacterium]